MAGLLMVIALMILPALALLLNSDRDIASISSQWRVKPASGISRVMGVQQLTANVPSAMGLSSGSCVLFDYLFKPLKLTLCRCLAESVGGPGWVSCQNW